MMKTLRYLATFLLTLARQCSSQECPEERTSEGISVLWHPSKPANNITSDPLCFFRSRLVTRQCNESGWSPALDELPPCLRTVEDLDVSSCPPGYHQVSGINNRYCYQISSATPWSYPCLTSGGGTVITDLSNDEFNSLLASLQNSSSSKYFWLPAQRRKTFSPIVWNIPGPNWGQVVDRDDLQMFPSVVKNCLMLDVEKETLDTEACASVFPSLCLYLNDVDYPSHCPNGYYRFRFMSEESVCLGIERAGDPKGLTFQEFLSNRCHKPMGDSMYNDLTKFLFLKLADVTNLPGNDWCWFKSLKLNDEIIPFNIEKNTNNISNSTLTPISFQGIVNRNGTEMLMDALALLPCMACEFTLKVCEKPALELEFNPDEFKLFLTVYFPSALWKYVNNDIGVICFSDAKGYVKPIDIKIKPVLQVLASHDEDNTTKVEKNVYVLDLVTNRSAQYWCEAHNKSFSLLTSNKIVASSKANSLHVFALVVKISTSHNESFPCLEAIVNNVSQILQANKVLLMDVLEYTPEHIIILIHLHVNTVNNFEDDAKNLQATLERLKEKAEEEFTFHGMDFVNISSSLYCLPSVSYTDLLLEWELTKIGEVAAPSQFCLQSNGLPVRRQCLGSYLLGSHWGEVEGTCNESYEPSNKTTFLYKFVKGQVPEKYTSRFLVEGLEFVLNDTDSIIPADIYYLSVSFKHVLEIALQNESSIEMGDLDNMAWAVDRIMQMDINYLRLSQTFNSTNVILDSVNDVIEKLARVNNATNEKVINNSYPSYQLSIKPKYVVQISYPLFSNITGLALVRKDGNSSDLFMDMAVMPLFANSSLEDLIEIENLEVATWVPDNVLATLRYKSNNSDQFVRPKNIHIVLSVYYNDAVFQQLDPSDHEINSRVIGLTIPGYETNLLYPIPLLFKEFKSNYSTKVCGFWDFETMKTNPGFWSNRGCYYQKSLNNITICHCYHMTHFGQLLHLGEISKPRYPQHSAHVRVLNVITLVGSFLSLFGIFGLWITALVFQTWRKKPGTKILLQLSTAVSMPLVLMIVFNLDNTIFYKTDGKYVVREHKKITCIILGSLLHYSILASFSWMLITAVLQFVRYVRVLGVCRPSRFLFKFAAIGWGIPLIPVAVIWAIEPQNYIPDPTTEPEKRICYPKGIYLLLSVVAPISLVLVVNVALFCSVLCSISSGPEGKMKSADMDLIKAQFRLSLFLFFLLGLTWIFGIFSFLNNTVMWSYLFCLTSTLQGFVLFVYFVICDPATRNLWVTLMTPQFQTASSRKSVSSISSG